MTPRQQFWLYLITGDIFFTLLSPGQQPQFYLLAGIVAAAIASALADY